MESNGSTRPFIRPPVAIDAVVADSPAQFCARTSTSESRFYEMVKDGRLRITKAGRRTLVPRSEILRYLEDLEAGKVMR